ncbi:hypothetical protein STEG23_009485 [Scotinomys teguina]
METEGVREERLLKQVWKQTTQSSPNIALKFWRIPGELLVFSLPCYPEDAGFDIDRSNRIGELATKSDGQQAKNKIPSSMSLWAATRRCGPDSGFLFPTATMLGSCSEIPSDFYCSTQTCVADEYRWQRLSQKSLS